MQIFNWTSITNSLPELSNRSNQDSEEVIVSLEDGSVHMDTYSIRYSMWIGWGSRVTHWAYKPKPAERENE